MTETNVARRQQNKATPTITPNNAAPLKVNAVSSPWAPTPRVAEKIVLNTTCNYNYLQMHVRDH